MRLQYTFILALIFWILPLQMLAQEEVQKNSLPPISLKDLNGKAINVAEITNEGRPFVLCFGKTTCKVSVTLLDEIAEDYEDWQEESSMAIYYVATNNARSSSKVAPFVNVREWEYEVLLDPNSELKRAMNVVSCPHVFVLDGDGKLIWQKSGYTSETKEEIYQEIFNLIKQ